MTAGKGWEQPGHRPIWPLAVAFAVVVVAVAGLALALWSSGDEDGELAVGHEDAPPSPDAPGEDGTPTPWPRPSGYGVAPAPSPGEGWRWLPAAPIAARLEPLSAWTGEEFVVWGGTVGDDPVVDGAAYDPRRGTWRRLPDAPAAMAASTSAATWTGEVVVGWGDAGGRPGGVAYDPAADRWRALPDAPLEPGDRPPTVTWTGRDVLVFGEAGAAYDPAADRWRALPDAPLPQPAEPGRAHVAAWAGDARCQGCGSLFVWVAPSDPADDWPGAAYDPAAGRWAQTAPAEPGGAGLTATWTGEAVVLCCAAGGEAALAVYDPATDAWERPVEGPVARRTLHTARWIDGELLIWGGRQDRDRWLRGNGAAWDPATRRWRWLAEASPRIPRQLHTAAWTGRELLVWGGYDGREPRGDGAALDPFSR